MWAVPPASCPALTETEKFSVGSKEAHQSSAGRGEHTTLPLCPPVTNTHSSTGIKHVFVRSTFFVTHVSWRAPQGFDIWIHSPSWKRGERSWFIFLFYISLMFQINVNWWCGWCNRYGKCFLFGCNRLFWICFFISSRLINSKSHNSQKLKGLDVAKADWLYAL